MRRSLTIGFMSFCVLWVAACATPKTKMPTVARAAVTEEQRKQEDMVFERKMRLLGKLATAEHRLLAGNTELCGKEKRFVLGAQFMTGKDVEKGQHALWQRHYPMGTEPIAVLVAAGGPAAVAGLVAGDKITAVNGQVPDMARPSRSTWEVLLKSAPQQGSPVTLSVARDGQSQDMTVTPDQTCPFPVHFKADTDINAYADGEAIYVTQGMLEFVETETELAFVLGHELAHNHMEHIDAKKQNAYLAGAGGLLVDVLFAAVGVNTGGAFTNSAMGMGAASYSTDFEKEADYVGMYFIARAGYETDDIANFWRRMAIEKGRVRKHATSHPTSPERFIAMEETQGEIVAKMTAGAPLLPNMQE